MAVLVKTACTFLVVACVGVGLSRVADALDLKDFAVPPPAPEKPAWAGFYLKDNSGAGSGGPGWTTFAPSGGFSSGPAAPVNETFGYNFQSGNFVFGLEGAFSAANFDGRFTSPYLPAAGAFAPNMNWLGTVTGRVGYSFGQWLPYVKGGFATADVGTQLQGAPIGAFSQGTQANGWTGGVGVEYQFTPKLSLGVEYLYTDLGGSSVGSAPIGGVPEMYSNALKTQSLLGRLNYKPGW
jgi:outer membrane immunogenic protein